MKECIFCKINERYSKSFCLAENEHCKAILDTHPLNEGHILIITKQHYKAVIDVPLSVFQAVTTMGHRMAKVLEQEFNPTRVGLLIAGFDIDHFHLHVVPLYDRSDIATRRVFDNNFTQTTDANLSSVRDRIVARLS